ncbi:hypothetical protein H1R20_g1424, partial [Candolleomyces eurysporus]
MVTDKGSEVPFLFAHQTGLCKVYTPELDKTQIPPVIQLKSVHNTPIEGLWHWLTNTCGLNIKEIIISGYETGVYSPNNPIHPQLFNWIWPMALQVQLNKFTSYWNNHKIRTQRDKANMSGSTRHAFTAPDPARYEKCYVEIDEVVIDALRQQIPTPREEAMQFVDDRFLQLAEDAYEAVGSPDLSDIRRVWTIFAAMIVHIPANTN